MPRVETQSTVVLTEKEAALLEECRVLLCGIQLLIDNRRNGDESIHSAAFAGEAHLRNIINKSRVEKEEE
jgi:hypothetical protein